MFKIQVYAVSQESADESLSTIYAKFIVELEKVENAFELENVFQVAWVLFQELHTMYCRFKA